jgi:transcriptional regulator with XRE-family HTH domain
MPARGHALTTAARRTDRQLLEIGDEFLERRLESALSQDAVAIACRMSRNHYRHLEAGDLRTATVEELNRVAAVLGLELALRAFPGGGSLRDAAQGRRLSEFLVAARAPLYARLEVPLPRAEGHWERRAWDAVLFGHGERTTVELEMRLRDLQAMRRRHELKRRDDPSEHFLMLIADTRHNRRVLAEFEGLFADLPKLRPSAVRAALQAGRHPPTGLLLL